MPDKLSNIKIGLGIVLIGLFLNIGLGIAFGANEDAFQDYIAQGVATHPDLHSEASKGKIWRYAQRAHFHAGGIAAFSLGLLILVMFSELSRKMQTISSVLIGLGSCYPLAWLSMFFLAPSIGGAAAHEHLLTEFFTFVGVVGLLLGSLILVANLYLGLFKDHGR